MSAFEGQAIVHSLDDHVIPPDGANVWVLFGSIVLYEGMPDHYDYIDSAALYFQNQLNSYWDKVNKTLKRVLKDQKRKQPSQAGVVGQSDPEAANEFHGLSLKADDEALAATLEWVEKNRNKTWQVKVLPTEADGKWFVGDLRPGWYFIVVRARFGEFDAAWEANIMVQPGQTFTVPPAPSVVYKRSNWHRKGSSYPPSRVEVYESEAGEGIGFVFGFGARGPVEGGGAGPRAPHKIGAWPPPPISTWSVR